MDTSKPEQGLLQTIFSSSGPTQASNPNNGKQETVFTRVFRMSSLQHVFSFVFRLLNFLAALPMLPEGLATHPLLSQFLGQFQPQMPDPNQIKMNELLALTTLHNQLKKHLAESTLAFIVKHNLMDEVF
jgi:hypothetical protein